MEQQKTESSNTQHLELQWFGKSQHWTGQLFLFGMFLLFILIVIYGQYLFDKMYSSHGPLVNAIHKIQFKATSAHLWFEEIITGDTNKKIDHVWGDIDETIWYVTAILEGGEKDEMVISPVESDSLRQETEYVRQLLYKFKKITQTRLSNVTAGGIESHLDQEYDAIFRDFIARAKRIELDLVSTIGKEQRTHKISYIILLFLCVLFYYLGSVVFFFKEKERKKFQDELEGHRFHLEQLVKDRTTELTETNKQLKETIEQNKRAEEALQLSEFNFKNLFEHANDAIFISDPTTCKFIDCNENAAERLGYTQSELLNLKFNDIGAPREQSRAPELFEELKSKGQIIFKFTHLRKDGSEMPVEISAKIIEYYGKEQIVSFVRDISDRRDAEHKLRESEERFRSVVETANDAIITINRKGIVTFWNRAAEKIFGYGKEEITGQSCSILMPTRFRSQHETALSRFGHQKHSVISREAIEVEGLHKNGTTFPMELSLASWLSGTSWFVTGVVRDISERKNAEKDLWEAHELLEQRVQERTVELALKHRELKKETKERLKAFKEKAILEKRFQQAHKMEAIGTLAGGIAHDFNNILTAIFGYTELTLMTIPKDNVSTDNLEEVLKASRRAKELIGQILTFSRKDEQQYQEVQVASVVTEALKLIRASLLATILIEKKIETDLPIIIGNPTQIHQIVMNLGTNAAHAMNEVGTLTIELTCVELREGLKRDYVDLSPGSYIKLSVSDSGCGIPSENMACIFEPFYTTKEKEQGTGMGLSVVHGIVKGHRGDIIVESKPGIGTRFDVYLPATKRKYCGTYAEKQSLPMGTERILMVDDEVSLGPMVQKTLESLGYSVTIKTSSREALALFSGSPEQFDILLSDVTMPQMTGIQLARRCREIKPILPIVLWSGNESSISDQQMEALEISQLLLKPVKRQELAIAIREALDR